jgi:hypothetical protein
MPILLTSPDALLVSGGAPDAKLVAALKKIRESHPVALISNHVEPSWFQPAFAGSNVQFLRELGRQNGNIVSHNAKQLKMNPFDVVVLATKPVDVQMGKNGGAVLVAAGWSADPVVKALGISVASAAQLLETFDLITHWNGQWWFAADAANYRVRALADLSTINKDQPQTVFAEQVKNTVKGGGSRLAALAAVTSRSLLMDGMDKTGQVWGIFPSSGCHNNDSDVLSDFSHRIRTTVTRVRYAERGTPLFIRHAPSSKRSAGGSTDRTDPTEQIMTMQLNPFYAGTRLRGKSVVVIDDCTTYGVSFGVAAALLRKAGAASVTGIALGKFGNQLRHYGIDILSDPFKPIPKNKFKLNSIEFFAGHTNGTTQHALQSLIK